MAVSGAVVRMARKRNPKHVPEGQLPSVVLSVRMSREYREFLNRLAEHERCGVADVIDRAIADYAKKVKFGEQPPKR
jgi:hypothetical protein